MGQPTAKYITDEAKALRGRGAQVVVLIAHIGSACKDNDKPDDVSTCDTNDELFKVLPDVPKGLIDVVVAGHTHAAIAHRIAGMAVIESLSSGRAFGRVDLRVTETHVSAVTIHKPEIMCPLDREGDPQAVADCHPGPYEGRPVTPDVEVGKLVDAALERTAKRRDESLGVMLNGPITKAYKTESVEGDWIADLMLAARPDAEIALTNGGGLRADIAAGPLTYGRLFEAIPFDNRFAIVAVKGKHVRRLVTSNLQRDGGIYSWGGITVKASCKDGNLDVAIKVGKRPLGDDATYTLVTSDFLASGGDGVIGRLKLPEGSIKPTDVIIRDAMADVLRKQQGSVDPDKVFGPAHRRLDYEGKRPLICGGGAKQASRPEEPD
jgi:5'-nucleotidase